MKKKKLAVLLALITISLAAVIVIVSEVISYMNPGYECITNNEAAKMLLALEDDFVDSYEITDYVSIAVKYGLMDECDGDKVIRNKAISTILDSYGIDDSEFSEELELKKKRKAVRKDDWFKLYEYIISVAAPDKITACELTVIATPGTSENVQDWTVYTQNGKYAFYNLFVDGYQDRTIKAYVRNKEIIAVSGIVTEDITYHNVWIYKGDGMQINAYVDGIDRVFYPDGLSQPVADVMADISLSQGVLTNVSLKTDTINGRVLSVTDSYVELEGYGRVPFDENYRIYKNYGGFSQIGYEKILVGYELQDFIVADGKVCGAVVLYPFEVNNIRILIKNTGFETVYHEKVEITCNSDFKLMYGSDMSNVAQFSAGDVITFDRDNEILQQGRIRIIPNDSSQRLIISSIDRSQGKPAYPGFLEIDMDDKGLYIVNEINLEQYLKLVVPSEMPAGYGKEAAKVQAVCARSYAYNQLLNNDYREYGAHIDDSTWYQVYNNTNEYASSSQAVDETCGQVMTYDGDVITAYYYSTSCGHGSDISIWGNDASTCPYITAHTINPSGEFIDLTGNDAFLNFIKTKNQTDFDSSFTYYRWNAQLDMKQINEFYGDKANVGEITSIDVIDRKNGGSANEVVVTGTKGQYVVNGELNIRRFFGNSEIKMYNNNGKRFSMGLLPSGFVAFEPYYEKNKLAGYNIYGGGYGHGLGMSQNGAYRMTKEGYTYDAILKFFYEGIEITTLY
ncbi:MAG: SpoIID/LytB domain-containing protein [Lachnospiraceae bacterium]